VINPKANTKCAHTHVAVKSYKIKWSQINNLIKCKTEMVRSDRARVHAAYQKPISNVKTLRLRVKNGKRIITSLLGFNSLRTWLSF
jgi:hypothetical protein